MKTSIAKNEEIPSGYSIAAMLILTLLVAGLADGDGFRWLDSYCNQAQEFVLGLMMKIF